MSVVVRAAEQIGDTILLSSGKLEMDYFTAHRCYLLFEHRLLPISYRSRLEYPDKILDYLSTQFSFIGILLQISGAALFGSIIVEDIEKRTGNILHPKISKDRLIVGRFIALFIILTSIIVAYYLVVIAFAVGKYPGQAIPVEVWQSMGWALFNGLAIAAFVTFISSFAKTVNTSIILSLLMFIMVFPIITSVMSMTGTKTEPLFFLTYNQYIIEAIFKMPDPRYMEIPIIMGEMGSQTYFMWTTPDVVGAAWSLSIYTVVCLVLAYILYRRKE